MGDPHDKAAAPHDSHLSASEPSEELESQEDRAAILKRRASFVASAIAGLSLATFASACEPTPCLDYAPEGGTAGTGGTGTGGDCSTGGDGGATGGTGGTGGSGGDCGTTSSQ